MATRQTGKSTLIKELLESQDLYFNFNLSSEFIKYSKDVSYLVVSEGRKRELKSKILYYNWIDFIEEVFIKL